MLNCESMLWPNISSHSHHQILFSPPSTSRLGCTVTGRSGMDVTWRQWDSVAAPGIPHTSSAIYKATSPKIRQRPFISWNNNAAWLFFTTTLWSDYTEGGREGGYPHTEIKKREQQSGKTPRQTMKPCSHAHTQQTKVNIKAVLFL